jgi:hypothetical protein
MKAADCQLVSYDKKSSTVSFIHKNEQPYTATMQQLVVEGIQRVISEC